MFSRRDRLNITRYDCVQSLRPIKLPPASGRRLIAKMLPGSGRVNRPTDIAACPVNFCLYVGIAGEQQDDNVIVAIHLQTQSAGASDKPRFVMRCILVMTAYSLLLYRASRFEARRV